jgi:hypothetical protein
LNGFPEENKSYGRYRVTTAEKINKLEGEAGQ